ncbi:hypothetical protein CVD28_19505 [Bacillus sp. M6-12]|uniref:hypothetical protein n=1 Tax=Bacillus sp. M6-12 TaxID=2054166 RepID=UPI000C78E931|nr:hypothetical protein [Bacillus sp. M6-12]PLS15931.1 hypothetical protein CVD28_19505 [Bacillus sp. M6-12]
MKKSLIMATAITLGGLSSVSYAAVSDQKPVVNQETEVQTAAKTSAEEQLALLQRDLVPSNPKETVILWAKAVKNRNGALQYALSTDNTKAILKKPFETYHWVTGVSSPWVEKSKIVDKKKISSTEIEYKVQFELATSSGSAGIDSAIVVVEKKDYQWYISRVAPASEKTIGIWNTPESINYPN